MKIEINLKIIIILILFLIIQNIDTYIIFIAFILLHEIAHLIVGMLIGGIPKKLGITPFGASLEFYTYGKNNLLCRVFFFLIGPLTNLIIAIIFIFLENLNFYRQEIILTNIAICVFNLIPIIPLDGGKILKEILKFFVGSEKSNKYIMIISKLILIIISFIYAILIVKVKNIMILFLLIYLWYLYIIEEKKILLYEKASKSIRSII